MRGPHQGPKQTLGAATRRDVEERRCSVQPLSLTSFDKAGLRHPASAALRLRLAGRCPNNSSLFPPLAVVVAVAPGRGASGEEAKRYGMPKPPLLGEVARRSRDGEVVRRKAGPSRQCLSLWEQRRRPPPVAETGRSCWGSGQQDASSSEADAGSRNPGSVCAADGEGKVAARQHAQIDSQTHSQTQIVTSAPAFAYCGVSFAEWGQRI